MEDTDREVVACHRSTHHRLGFAVQLCTARFLGTFLEELTVVPVGVLAVLARHRLHPLLIKDNWDDMLRLAGSLKLGVVQALSIIRTLQIGDRPTKLAQAVAELG